MKAAILNASTLGTGKLTSRLAAALARLVSVAGLPLNELPLSDCTAAVIEIRRLSHIIANQQRPDELATELLQQYALMKQVLQSQVESQFGSLQLLDWSTDSESQPSYAHRFVQDVCNLVDAFGDGCMRRSVAVFAAAHCDCLMSHSRSSSSMPVLSAIDDTLSRYRRKVPDWEKLYDGCIPRKWDVFRELAQQFCSRVHELVSSELHGNFGTEHMEVSKLLNGLVKSAEFETELQQAFKVRRARVSDSDLGAQNTTTAATPDAVTPPERCSPALAAMEAPLEEQQSTNPFALERFQSTTMPMMQPTMPAMQQTFAATPAPPEPSEPQKELNEPVTAAPRPPPPKGFLGTITNAFIPFLPLYAEQEAGKLNELVQSVSSPQAVLISTDEAKVLSGSCELFIAIRASIQRCSKINNNMLLEELYRSALRPALFNYGSFLCTQGANRSHDLRTLAHVANSGKYCLETVTELESALHKMGGGTARAMSAWEVFTEAQERAISSVVGVLMAELDPILKKVSEHGHTGSRWSRRKHQEPCAAELGTQGSGFGGGCSMYVDELSSTVKRLNAPLLQHLLDECFDLVAAKFVVQFSDTYLQQILSCSKLSSEDVRQLLNDTATVQVILIEMDYPESLVGDQAPAGMQMAMAAMGKIIGMLETLTAETSTMAARYLQLVPHGSVEQLKQLLGTLDGMGRRNTDIVLREYTDRRGGVTSTIEEQGEFSPESEDPTNSRSGLHIRNRLRGFRDRLKTELRNSTNTMTNSTIVKGGYLDRMMGGTE